MVKYFKQTITLSINKYSGHLFSSYHKYILKWLCRGIQWAGKLHLPCCWTTHSSRRRHWPMARSMTAWERHVRRAWCGPQTARTWIQSIMLFGVSFNRWSINVNESRQSTSWSRRSSLSGAKCRARLAGTDNELEDRKEPKIRGDWLHDPKQ